MHTAFSMLNGRMSSHCYICSPLASCMCRTCSFCNVPCPKFCHLLLTPCFLYLCIPPLHQVVGFVPTGWLYEMKQSAYPSRTKGPCSVHLVPYSEHSSYAELREYMAWLRPKQVGAAAALRLFGFLASRFHPKLRECVAWLRPKQARVSEAVCIPSQLLLCGCKRHCSSSSWLLIRGLAGTGAGVRLSGMTLHFSGSRAFLPDCKCH
jgi:hypothetical protein